MWCRDRDLNPDAFWAVDFESTVSAIPPSRLKDAELELGAEGGTRTHTPFRITDFESVASAVPPLRLMDKVCLAYHRRIKEGTSTYTNLILGDYISLT
jgi:hypothetical protein